MKKEYKWYDRYKIIAATRPIITDYLTTCRKNAGAYFNRIAN